MKFAIFVFLFQSVCLGALPLIATSFSVLADITRSLVPEQIQVQSLVPAGMDSHGYEATAKDYILLKKADHIILVGPDFDPWALKAVFKVKSKTSPFYATKGISLLPLKESSHSHSHGKTLALQQHFDPHFWHSPEIAIQVIGKLSSYLQTSYPLHQAEIQKKTSDYIQKLKSLQLHFRNEFSLIPEKNRKMVIAHNSFQYFANEFGVKVDSPLDTSQSGESSLRRVSSLIKKIKKDKIQSLFFEKSSPEALMKSISKETNIPIAGVLYSDCLSENGEATTYLKLLDYNFSLILKSMKRSLQDL